MKKFLIEDVKVGVSNGGIACGPVPGNVVAEVCVRDVEDGTLKYYSMVEVEGIPNFFETDVSTYERQIKNDPNDDEFWDMLSEHSSGDFGDYYDFFDSLEETEPHDEAKAMIQRYLVYLVRADWDEIEQMKAKSISHNLGEFVIPVCDAEQDYLDEQGEEEINEAVTTEKELLEDVRDAYEGLAVDTGLMELEEGETPAAWYRSYEFFHENGNEFRLTYGFDLNDDGEFTGIDEPVCERVEGDTFIPCTEGEVSMKRIYQELRNALDSWM